MRYDATRDCYVGNRLVVPASLFDRTMARRVQLGQDPDVALEDLLDEFTWSAWMPGVTRVAQGQVGVPCRAGKLCWAGALPWELRPVVTVVHADAAIADLLQDAFEQAGYRAPTFVRGPTQGLAALQVLLTPAPTVCLFDVSSPLGWVWFRVLQAQLPAGTMVSTGPPITEPALNVDKWLADALHAVQCSDAFRSQ